MWVCTVCLGLLGRQLMYEILEQLPYLTFVLGMATGNLQPHLPYFTFVLEVATGNQPH